MEHRGQKATLSDLGGEEDFELFAVCNDTVVNHNKLCIFVGAMRVAIDLDKNVKNMSWKHCVREKAKKSTYDYKEGVENLKTMIGWEVE